MNLEQEIFEISLNDIMPNRFQPREIFDDNALNELAQSIKEHGVIQPIIVRKVGDKYEIIAGERRFRASQLAGKETIPALVRNIDDKEAAKIALLENLQRRDLTPIEEAKTYQTILKLENMTQEELAKSLGKSQSAIANKIRLLNLDEEVQTALLNQKISERHARSLLTLDSVQMQKDLLNKIIINRLTVRQLDEEIMRLTGKAVNIDDEIGIEKEEQMQIEIPSTPQNVISNEIKNQNDEIKTTFDINDLINQNQTELTNQNNIETSQQSELIDQNITIPNQPEITNQNVIIPQQSDLVDNNIEAPQALNITNKELIDEQPAQAEDINYNIFNNLRVETENKPIEQEEKIIEEPNYNDVYDLRFAINNVRQAVQNTEKFGFKIETEEFDFENVYQIVIKIDKNK